nr:oxysterol-binding protein homolog 1-like [Ipomoea batatas]
MLDKDGYLKHPNDRATIERFIKCFEGVGLMKYLTHAYKTIHTLDATEFFANARLNKDRIPGLLEEVKGKQALEELKFSFKKKALKLEFESVIDILTQIVENRVAGTDDVTKENFTMLTDVLNNYLVDRIMVIFNFVPRLKQAVLRRKAWAMRRMPLRQGNRRTPQPYEAYALDTPQGVSEAQT